MGSGVTVVSSQHGQIEVPEENKPLEINTLMLETGAYSQVAYYWFKVGDTFTSSYWKQQFLIALKTLFRQPASSALIRVSNTVRDSNVAQAEEDAEEFIRLIVPQLYEYLP
jgi:EpsI family protein